MNVADEREGSADIRILDDAIPILGWQPLEVDRLPSATGAELKRSSTGAAWSAKPAVNTPSALVFSLPSRASSSEAVERQRSAVTAPVLFEVPASAFVSIGRVSGEATISPAFSLRRLGPGGANDNFTAGASTKKSVWRDLFFLAVLAATVAVAFLSGRVHGFQKVIVVPGPSSFYSVVT